MMDEVSFDEYAITRSTPWRSRFSPLADIVVAEVYRSGRPFVASRMALTYISAPDGYSVLVVCGVALERVVDSTRHTEQYYRSMNMPHATDSPREHRACAAVAQSLPYFAYEVRQAFFSRNWLSCHRGYADYAIRVAAPTPPVRGDYYGSHRAFGIEVAEHLHYFLRRGESSVPVGSSASIMDGCVTSARAMATRCFWPPDISPADDVRAVGESHAFGAVPWPGGYCVSATHPDRTAANATFSPRFCVADKIESI